MGIVTRQALGFWLSVLVALGRKHYGSRASHPASTDRKVVYAELQSQPQGSWGRVCVTVRR